MLPIAAIAAGRLGSQVLQNLAAQPLNDPSQPPAGAAPAAAPFQEIMTRVASSPEVERARILRQAGITTASDVEPRLTHLADQLAADPKVRELLSHDGSAYELRLTHDNRLVLSTRDGRTRTLEGLEVSRELVEDTRRILRALAGDTASVGMRITPGGSAILVR